MAEPQYEVEKQFYVWDNKHGDCVVIRPDGDGLGLVEMYYMDKGGEKRFFPPITTEWAEKVAEAIQECASTIEATSLNKS